MATVGVKGLTVVLWPSPHPRALLRRLCFSSCLYLGLELVDRRHLCFWVSAARNLTEFWTLGCGRELGEQTRCPVRRLEVCRCARYTGCHYMIDHFLLSRIVRCILTIPTWSIYTCRPRLYSVLIDANREEKCHTCDTIRWREGVVLKN